MQRLRFHIYTFDTHIRNLFFFSLSRAVVYRKNVVEVEFYDRAEVTRW